MTPRRAPSDIKAVIIGICLCRVHGTKAVVVAENKASGPPFHPGAADRDVKCFQLTSSVLDQMA